jgi:hypothetical protein
MENAVGTEPAIGQRLRAIPEPGRKSVAALVGDREDLLILYQVELDEACLVNDGIGLYISPATRTWRVWALLPIWRSSVMAM